jgi:integrase
MTLPQYVRRKRAKGREYYYFDTGQRTDTGTPVLSPLPHIKDPSFGGALVRAKAARTQRKNKRGVLTLDGLIRLYQRSPEFRGLSEATKISYDRYLERASKLIRTRTGESPPVKLIERRDVLTLRDTLADTPGAASQTVRAVGALFAWAIDNEKAKDNPAKGVKKFKGKPHERWPLDLLEEGLADPQVGMAVALLYFTGQRINEVVSMSWNDIRGDHMIVNVKKKGNQIRVAISPELDAMLRRQPKTAVTILTNANGQPWTQSGLRQKLQDWAAKRGRHVVPHGLRKNAVNSLFEAGCTAMEVSGITDQSLKMLEHYSKRVNKLSLGRAAVVKFDAARTARNKAGK